MIIFNVERIPSRSFGRCELSVMVETRGGYEDAVRRGGCEEEPEPK